MPAQGEETAWALELKVRNMEHRLHICVALEMSLSFLVRKMVWCSSHCVWQGHGAEFMRQHTAWSALFPHQSSFGADAPGGQVPCLSGSGQSVSTFKELAQNPGRGAVCRLHAHAFSQQVCSGPWCCPRGTEMSPMRSRDQRGPCMQEQSKKASSGKCGFHGICLGDKGLPDSGMGMCRGECENECHHLAPCPIMATHTLSRSQETSGVTVMWGCPQTRARTPQKIRAADHMEATCATVGVSQAVYWVCSATSWLCDLRQISQALCTLDSSSVGVIVRMEWLGHVAGAVSVLQLGHPGAREGNGASGGTQHGSIILPPAEPHGGQCGRGIFVGSFSPWVKKQGQLQPGL